MVAQPKPPSPASRKARSSDETGVSSDTPGMVTTGAGSPTWTNDEEPSTEELLAIESDELNESEQVSEALELNLHDVLALMANELERLQLQLDNLRLQGDAADQSASDSCNQNHGREKQIRDLVHQIDERQDRLTELKAMLLANPEQSEH